MASVEEENKPQTLRGRIEKAVGRASNSRAEDGGELVRQPHQLNDSQRRCSYLKAELEEALQLTVEGTHLYSELVARAKHQIESLRRRIQELEALRTN